MKQDKMLRTVLIFILGKVETHLIDSEHFEHKLVSKSLLTIFHRTC